MMPGTRRKFDPEFREGAVLIVTETGKPIAQVARDLGINQGTPGNWVKRDHIRSAHDNAPAESFFSTLEHERLPRYTYTTRDQACLDIARWIDDFYNRKRRRSTNGMKSPIDYETEYRKLQSETADTA